ncbi:LysR family transcriptional regulator [Tropicimonas sediminicola]|uniref:DNA-binding transcriptional regulator, LysR family n=1 Tax=Tropicimonas sediminicola TaxID=1031541 RepID=A0A239LAW6_9RHOB|nr:LysR family transcriptional regulator [Tropicimonas sediminicola]SNT27776.1 DNA-binding transcriptional regulator, LysR family [Tropicimonas sediminicola]
MELKQLKTLIAIAEAGSLSSAAVRLKLTQPALSASLRRLEDELGVSLVRRHPRGATLTREGRIVLQSAYEVMHEVSEIASVTAALQETPVGRVRLGLPTTVAGGLIPELLPALRDRFPQVTIYLLEAMSGVLSEKLQLGHLDMAILYDIEPMAGLRSQALLKERLSLLVPPGHRLAERGRIRLTEVADLEIALPSSAHSIRRQIETVCQIEGVQLSVAADIDSLSGVINLVRKGVPTILPVYRVVEKIAAGEIVAIDIERPRLEWTVHLAMRQDANRPRAALAVSELVSEICLRLVTEGHWPGEVVR